MFLLLKIEVSNLLLSTAAGGNLSVAVYYFFIFQYGLGISFTELGYFSFVIIIVSTKCFRVISPATLESQFSIDLIIL